MVSPKLVLVDGHSLLHRAYHALPPLSTSNGEEVGAVFGFISMFLKVLNELKPEYAAVAFDTEKPTFRHKEYTQYKAQRPKVDEELKKQIKMAKRVIEVFNISGFELDGYEADDIIGALAYQSTRSKKDLEVVIVTGDLDALQLVSDRVKVYTTRRGFSDIVVYDVKAVEGRYGLAPGQLVDYKALCGDVSDNIPGVKGIGKKTASRLLSVYGNLLAIFCHLDKLSAKEKTLLKKQQDSAFISQKLAKIKQDVPIKFDLDKCRIRKYNRNQVLSLFQELEFRSLISRLPGGKKDKQVGLFQGGCGDLLQTVNKEKTPLKVKDSGVVTFSEKIRGSNEYTVVDSDTAFQQMLEEIEDSPELAIDTEATSINSRDAKLVGISLSIKPGKAWYIPNSAFKAQKSKLRVVLENPKIKKIGHNLKYDTQILENERIDLRPLSFDTMIAAFLLQEGQGKLSLKDLAFSKLGVVIPETSEIIGKGRERVTMDKVPLEKVAHYACLDVEATVKLKKLFEKVFTHEKKLAKLFFEVEMPLVKILLATEKKGILLDTKFLSSLSRQMQKQIAKKEKEIFNLVGHEFNLNSPQQLEEVLFDELKLPVIKRTKTQRSTDESVLKKLVKLHPLIKFLLKYRELHKIKSTYVDPLPLMVDSEGRIHTSFNQARVATGRLSSENPNLQNIPVDKEFGIREAFIAPKGYKLLSADYSQIELRIMAHFSKDRGLIASFEAEQDIHIATAARIFDCFVNEVTSKQRKVAKTMNFAVMYGMSAHGLAEILGIERHKAQEYIDEYFESYPGIKTFIERTLEEAYKKGKVETFAGRRRLIPELSSSRFSVRKGGERMAVNHPIQGTAADLIKLAMVKIDLKLKTQNSKLILQVHDELVFEVPKGEVEEVGGLVKREMEGAMKLCVPLKVDLKVGNNWGELKTLVD